MNLFARLWKRAARAFWISRPGAFVTAGPDDMRPRPGVAAPRAADFYASREWRVLRYRVLRRSNGRCACCGRSSADGIQIHVDHIQPRSKAPELALVEGNLQILCADCNMGKGNTDSIDWR